MCLLRFPSNYDPVFTPLFLAQTHKLCFTAV